jgi:cathepsin H
MTNFETTLNQIISHNSKSTKTWTMGINEFSDMSDESFNRAFLIQDPQNCSATHSYSERLTSVEIPESWDWRDYDGVSPVKYQAHCGSCWTFSTTGCLEAHYRIHNKQNYLFSEQQLVDCAQAFDNHGCNGGLPSHAFEYIKYNGGIQTEDTYPYQGKDGSCQFDKELAVGQVLNGSFNITAGAEDLVAEAIATVGPVSVAFEVVDGFRNYRSGVYTSDVCKNSPTDVNHAVLAIGYGVEEGKDYFLVKNSWGADWGDKGYFKIERGTNMCGMAQCNSFPNIGQLVDIPQHNRALEI